MHCVEKFQHLFFKDYYYEISISNNWVSAQKFYSLNWLNCVEDISGLQEPNEKIPHIIL